MENESNAKLIISILIILIFGIFFIPKEFLIFYVALIIIVFSGIIGYALIKDKLKAKEEKISLNEENKNEKKQTKIEIKEMSIEEKKKLKEKLFEERRELVEALKEAEKQLMKNKISKKDFEKISNEKNARIISIDAEIKHIDSGLPKSELNQIKEVSEENREKMKQLLDEKQKKINELKFLEQNYLKRKITEDSYKKLSATIHADIISINSKINTLKNSESIKELKKKLKEEALIAKKEKLLGNNKKSENIENDIFKQLGLR